MVDYTSLLGRIATRYQDDEPMAALADGLPAPLPATAIERAEQRLGFQLHPLLAAVYGELANGGFGPDCQLFSLTDGPTEVFASSTSVKAGEEIVVRPAVARPGPFADARQARCQP